MQIYSVIHFIQHQYKCNISHNLYEIIFSRHECVLARLSRSRQRENNKRVRTCIRYAPFLILSFLNFLLVASEAWGKFFFSRRHDRLRETWRARKIFIHTYRIVPRVHTYTYTASRARARTKTAGRRVLWLVFRIIPRDIIWGFISWNHGGLTGWFPPSVKTADSSKANPPPPPPRGRQRRTSLNPLGHVYISTAIYTSPIPLSTILLDPGRGDAAGFAVSFQ